MAISGSADVGQTPVVVLGPLTEDVLVQNQSAKQMVLWLTADLEAEPIGLSPFGRTIVPAGAEGVIAAAPMSKELQRLFYSSLAVEDGTYATLTRG